MVEEVRKRDGAVVPFAEDLITAAIRKAMQANGDEDIDVAAELASIVTERLERLHGPQVDVVNIEAVQDAVIFVLNESGHYELALAYVRYRDSRERARRNRLSATGEHLQPNLMVIGRDGYRRPYDRTLLLIFLRDRLEMPEKAAHDVLVHLERSLASCDATELTSTLLLSLVDAAMVATGLHHYASTRAPLRIDRSEIDAVIAGNPLGIDVLQRTGRAVLLQHSFNDGLPQEVGKNYAMGRLWVDGLDDPLRGSDYLATIDSQTGLGGVIQDAFAEVAEVGRYWRQVSVVLPPIVLAQLERGDEPDLVRRLEALAHQAQVYLYCDGRTPLVDRWPFRRGCAIGLATYSVDFLLQNALEKMGIPLIHGQSLLQGRYRRRVGVKLALNAQGFEDDYDQMDLLALAAVAASRFRARRLAEVTELAGAEFRFAIYGLPNGSPSSQYLEQQVVQEGLRRGLALSRTSSLPMEACQHLGRLFDSAHV